MAECCFRHERWWKHLVKHQFVSKKVAAMKPHVQLHCRGQATMPVHFRNICLILVFLYAHSSFLCWGLNLLWDWVGFHMFCWAVFAHWVQCQLHEHPAFSRYCVILCKTEVSELSPSSRYTKQGLRSLFHSALKHLETSKESQKQLAPSAVKWCFWKGNTTIQSKPPQSNQKHHNPIKNTTIKAKGELQWRKLWLERLPDLGVALVTEPGLWAVPVAAVPWHRDLQVPPPELPMPWAALARQNQSFGTNPGAFHKEESPISLLSLCFFTSSLPRGVWGDGSIYFMHYGNRVVRNQKCPDPLTGSKAWTQKYQEQGGHISMTQKSCCTFLYQCCVFLLRKMRLELVFKHIQPRRSGPAAQITSG